MKCVIVAQVEGGLKVKVPQRVGHMEHFDVLPVSQSKGEELAAMAGAAVELESYTYQGNELWRLKKA